MYCIDPQVRKIDPQMKQDLSLHDSEVTVPGSCHREEPEGQDLSQCRGLHHSASKLPWSDLTYGSLTGNDWEIFSLA